jgi:hypothetical protein
MKGKNMTKRGGFIPAAALAGLLGRSALSWAVPKALNYMTKKKKGKGHKKGHGVVVPGSRGGALYLHGSMPKPARGRKAGRALYMPGASKPGRGIKEMAMKAMNNPMIKQMVDRAKSQVKRHINYAIDNPEKAYKNVKKMITGKGMQKSVGKSMRTLSVKQRRLPKQKVGIESSQQGGTTSITISRHFKPNQTIVQPMTFKQIKNKM